MKTFYILDIPLLQKRYSPALIYHWIISEEGVYLHFSPFLELPAAGRNH